MKAILSVAALILVLPLVARTQVAILHIRVVEGEGAVYRAGARIPHPLAVDITDETGKPVEGAAVNFHLPEDEPTGAFSNGLRTDVVLTDARGRAVLRAIQLNRAPGRLEIRIVASKEQARAGMVSFQYVTEPKNGAASAGGPKSRPSLTRGPLKWAVLAAAVGAAAAAGALAAKSRTSSAEPAPAASASVAGISIGSPSLTVGKP